MDDSKLKLFTNEEDVRSYTKVNGGDEGAINNAVSRWKQLQKKDKVLPLTKKVSTIDNMEIKG